MKFSPVSASINIKLLLVLIAAVIAISTLIYTQNLVSKLQNRETEIVKLYASSLEFIANSETSNLDYTFIFQNIIQRIDFPLILTDADDLVSSPVDEGGFKNIQIDSTLSSDKKTEFIQEMVKKLAQEHEPISVKTPDGIVLQKIYYGDSEVIRQLRYYPFAQIIIAFIFILIAYVSFSYIKRTEQSNIWVGMSKETAHQLGTPISSLMGWNEMLKLNFNNPDKVLDTSNEIDSDLERLNKITKRFSKIGSKPELKEQNLYEVIQKVVNYFHRRIPQLGKNVQIKLSGDINMLAKINSELFEWVIENLIKNALDAIEHNNGEINFSITKEKNKIAIEVSDNGKGIEHKHRKDVFRPGYSTKKRGWGLGLSLSKRIIENYHNGKIFVKNSVIDEGTTFRIVLRDDVKST
jgi:hypothetical protein